MNLSKNSLSLSLLLLLMFINTLLSVVPRGQAMMLKKTSASGKNIHKDGNSAAAAAAVAAVATAASSSSQQLKGKKVSMKTDEEKVVVYGQFTVLGKNGQTEAGMYHISPFHKIHYKIELKRRVDAKGIYKEEARQLLKDNYDEKADMFQFGRLTSGEHNHYLLMSGYQDRRISRYSFRIVANREAPHNVKIYASGFNEERQIEVGRKRQIASATGVDAEFTTTGIRLLTPDWKDRSPEKIYSQNYWHEVAIDGAIYKFSEPQQSNTPVIREPAETNELKDGTLVDANGVTLLWRSADGLKSSITKEQLDGAIEKHLNKREIAMIGMEPAFHKDLAKLDHAFLPCGHIASKGTVEYWSHIAIRDAESKIFRPVCPFCNKALDVHKEPFF